MAKLTGRHRPKYKTGKIRPSGTISASMFPTKSKGGTMWVSRRIYSPPKRMPAKARVKRTQDFVRRIAAHSGGALPTSGSPSSRKNLNLVKRMLKKGSHGSKRNRQLVGRMVRRVLTPQPGLWSHYGSHIR